MSREGDAAPFADRISDRGCDQSDPHILGEIDAGVVGKHAAIGNCKSQLATPDETHINLVAHALDVWPYITPELDLADADGAALARRARPAEPIADDLPHGVQAETSGHHGVAGKVTSEKPEVRRDIQFTDDMALAEFAAGQADLRDTVYHQHGRSRQLGIARAEIAALARSQQIFFAVGRLRRVKVVWVGQDDILTSLAGGC